MNGILDFYNEPAMLLGLFIMVSLFVMKQPTGKVLNKTLKAMIGYVLLVQGGQIILQSLKAFHNAFLSAFSTVGIITSNEAATVTVLQYYGTEVILIMLFGFLCNVCIARYSKHKYVFLTGHHILYMASLLAAVLNACNMSSIQVIVLGSLLLGEFMVICPMLIQPFYKKIIGDDSLALGHFSVISYSVSCYVARLFGNQKEVCEQKKNPKRFDFLRDTTIATALNMFAVFIVVFACANSNDLILPSTYHSKMIYGCMQAIVFTGGFVVVMLGVRMIVTELIPIFQTIADRVVPNHIPALDATTIFALAPNAVITGFIYSFLGAILGLFILLYLKRPLILTGLIPLFFAGGTAGVLSMKQGSKKGCCIGSVCNGLLITLLPSLLLPYANVLFAHNTVFGDADFSFVGIVVGKVFATFNLYGVIGLSIVLFVLLMLRSFEKKPKKNYHK